MSSALVAAVLVAVAAVHHAAGCSDFAMQSSSGKYQMSARTMDFYVTFDTRISGLKEGSVVKYPPTCPTCEPVSFRTKYDIVGAVTAVNYEFGFNDGLNSAGLSVGMLYDDGVQPVPASSTGSRPAIPFMYVPSYILGNFKTVAEVQAAMKPELLELTSAWLTPKAPLFFMPVHFAISDATGASAVLELEETGNYVVRTNPLRTLTNSPNLPLHEEYYAAFVDNTTLVPPYVNENLDAMFPGHDVKSRFVNVPGDATSASRRIRLAQYRQLQEQGGAFPFNVSYLGYLPDTVEAWSPNYGNNEWLETFAMTMNAMQKAVILNGLGEGIKTNNEEGLNHPYDPAEVVGVEQTLFLYIRDHTNQVYYWWTHRAQRWQSFDLKAIKRSFLAPMTPLPAVVSAVYDRTAEMNGVGVQVSATGAVVPELCWDAQCPAQVRGLGIRCQCGGKRAYSSGGTAAPMTREQAFKIVAGFPWDKPAKYDTVPTGDMGVLTVQVTSCGALSPQECCNVFATAVRSQQTLLPVTAPVACITAEGATLAPSH